MRGEPAYRVGPYRFSLSDARRTLAQAGDLLAAMGSDTAAVELDPYRSRVSAALEGIDPAHDPADVLAGPLHAVWAVLTEAAAELRARGLLPIGGAGRVAGLHRSGGGVPKATVDSVEVGYDGVLGDSQANRALHGRPWQALCLWSLEVIEAFQAEGHPLRPGATGENVTVAGLAWSDVRPGVRLAVGDVVCDVSAYTLPCTKNARWFKGGEFRLMHHDRGPASRVYATVVQPGRITTGDEIRLIT